jgi:hypothetical protein
MISERFTTFPVFSRRLNPQWLIRLFVVVSVLYGFCLVYNMDHYLPWQVRLMRAAKVTLLGHCGLWLGTFEIRGRLRFLVAAMMLPSIAGVFLLWWNVHLLIATGTLIGMSWFFYRVVQGTRFGD